jgi:hypothetical protein
MSPKEKAESLVEKFESLNSIKMSDDSRIEYPTARQCALIAVDEVLNALEEHRWQNRLIMDYWEEIKQEIKSL